MTKFENACNRMKYFKAKNVNTIFTVNRRRYFSRKLFIFFKLPEALPVQDFWLSKKTTDSQPLKPKIAPKTDISGENEFRIFGKIAILPLPLQGKRM